MYKLTHRGHKAKKMKIKFSMSIFPCHEMSFLMLIYLSVGETSGQKTVASRIKESVI